MSKQRSRLSQQTHQKNEQQCKKNSSTILTTVYVLFIGVVAIFISYWHYRYIFTLFENDRHFSHLSTLERELSFRTEMGLYYSYFKQISIESTSFLTGLSNLIYDNRTEAPSTINVLERFNLYPEVALSIVYRLMNTMNLLSETCYHVNRGNGMSPVQSCEGLKEPTYFYVTSVFIINGCLLGILFLLGTYLSKSIFGGFLSISAYMFNHGEATRVMWFVSMHNNDQYSICIVLV
jgi:C-mannosyltransferase DPY19L